MNVERPIDPPEPSARVAFSCAICDEAIYVGEDYYDIPGVGKCCVGCIDDCKHYDAEDESYNAYVDMQIDEMREEAILHGE